jgi:hypothetical protein
VTVSCKAGLERHMQGDLSVWNHQKDYWQTISFQLSAEEIIAHL